MLLCFIFIVKAFSLQLLLLLLLRPGECSFNVLLAAFRKGEEVPELDWCEPGESAAMEILKGGKDGFLTKRIKVYATDRNNPLKPRALSGLSPYLHFGQISAQRCAFEARNVRKVCPQVGWSKFKLNEPVISLTLAN